MYKLYVEVKDQLNLSALSKCKLNDFEAFKQLLFTDEEREVPYKWNKFIRHPDGGDTPVREFDRHWHVAVPYATPQTIVEHQINHFVLWGCITSTGVIEKPRTFYCYNTGEILDRPFCGCYACEYAGWPDCKVCPIWKPHAGKDFCMCEPDENYIPDDVLDYYWWDHYEDYAGNKSPSDFSRVIQYKTWTDKKGGK